MMMRSLEVLDRNGSRPSRVKGVGPLRPVAEWAVLLTQLIVRNFQQNVVDNLRHLYSCRGRVRQVETTR